MTDPERIDIDDLADAEVRGDVVDQQTAAEAGVEQVDVENKDVQDVLPAESAAHPS